MRAAFASVVEVVDRAFGHGGQLRVWLLDHVRDARRRLVDRGDDARPRLEVRGDRAEGGVVVRVRRAGLTGIIGDESEDVRARTGRQRAVVGVGRRDQQLVEPVVVARNA